MAQLELLADMCRGRSQLPILHLEKSFPYSMLLNLANRADLPCCFKAACLSLIQVLPAQSCMRAHFYCHQKLLIEKIAHLLVANFIKYYIEILRSQKFVAAKSTRSSIWIVSLAWQMVVRRKYPNCCGC